MQKAKFIRIVKSYYASFGRHDLPWRHTTDPYRIAVSEIMLQQTQVPRVLEKYKEFLKMFPTVKDLAKAPLAEVIKVWSGLGYNRRARFLHMMAKEVLDAHNGKFPQTVDELKALAGIGPYSSAAIAAFAYNVPSVCIETNIRTVYIHHFFSDRSDVSDKELLPYIASTLDTKNPREWYWALMDYGSYLKSQGVRTHRASVHYTKQSTFEGSRRQIRGEILKMLIEGPKTLMQFCKNSKREVEDIESVLADLVKEKMIKRSTNTWYIY